MALLEAVARAREKMERAAAPLGMVHAEAAAQAAVLLAVVAMEGSLVAVAAGMGSQQAAQVAILAAVAMAAVAMAGAMRVGAALDVEGQVVEGREVVEMEVETLVVEAAVVVAAGECVAAVGELVASHQAPPAVRRAAVAKEVAGAEVEQWAEEHVAQALPGAEEMEVVTLVVVAWVG